LKTAIFITANRHHLREFDRPEPWSGMAPETLLQGFCRVAAARRPSKEGNHAGRAGGK
jgi:hypothetical protein